jgi:hypothetical protein
MPRWLEKVIARIHELAARGAVRLTYKALREAALLDLALDDVVDVIGRLRGRDSAGRLLSETTGEWMYVFKPDVVEHVIYVKLILRADCVVVSFHEDLGAEHEADE